MDKELQLPRSTTLLKYFDPESKRDIKDYVIVELLDSVLSEDDAYDPEGSYDLVYGRNEQNNIVVYALDELHSTKEQKGKIRRLEILDKDNYWQILMLDKEIPNMSDMHLKKGKINKAEIHVCRSDDFIKEFETKYENIIKKSLDNYNERHPGKTNETDGKLIIDIPEMGFQYNNGQTNVDYLVNSQQPKNTSNIDNNSSIGFEFIDNPADKPEEDKKNTLPYFN